MIIASIVTYKTDIIELERILSCVVDSSVDKICIIDNSPTDYLRKLESFSSKIEYFFGHGNVGYGAAHNIAMSKSIESRSKYHIVINPDIYFENGTIEELEKYMEENQGVGQVMPRVIYPNGELQYVCKLVPTPFDLIFKRFFPAKFISKSSYRFQLKFTEYKHEMNVPYLSGCFMFFRVSAFEKVGLFDERFFMYPEDIDITRRMHREYKTMFYPKVQIVHAHAAESRKSKRMLWVHIINMIKYFNKWGWFFDRERRLMNKQLLNELGYND